MIACPRYGFVMLSLPKCASTSVVRAIQPYAQVVLTGEPRLKHVNVTRFEQLVEPLLAHGKYPREDYELVSMFREPTAWLQSWWRFRSRPGLRRRKSRYVGDLTFEEFARGYLDHAKYAPGRPVRFLLSGDGSRIGVDRLLQLERAEVWQRYFSEQVGTEISYGQYKASREHPVRSSDLTERTRADLRAYFAPEYEIYDHLLANDGQWAPPAGYLPAGWISGSKGS